MPDPARFDPVPSIPSGTAPALLRVSGLRKEYALGRRVLKILDGIELEVRHGEFVAIQGASGAGKSTLLHLLCGLDRADAGSIVVDGQPIHERSTDAASRWRNQRIGFVFQSYHLLPDLEAVENVALPARMARVPRAEAFRRARALLDRAGVGDRWNHRPSELSGGEQQRVAIARALINNPVLLLADEPTGNLDSKSGAAVIELLLQLRQESGSTLLLVTHDDALAARAERIIRLADGRVAGPG